jgi:hypothetical protein
MSAKAAVAAATQTAARGPDDHVTLGELVKSIVTLCALGPGAFLTSLGVSHQSDFGSAFLAALEALAKKKDKREVLSMYHRMLLAPVLGEGRAVKPSDIVKAFVAAKLKAEAEADTALLAELRPHNHCQRPGKLQALLAEGRWVRRSLWLLQREAVVGRRCLHASRACVPPCSLQGRLQDALQGFIVSLTGADQHLTGGELWCRYEDQVRAHTRLLTDQ